MKFFIKLEKQNSNMVRYFAVGEHDSQNKFTGIVYGYEGGGEFSDAFIYKNKFLPSYFEDEPIEWDEQLEVFDKISKYTFDELDSKIRDYAEFNTNSLQWLIYDETKELFDSGVVYSTMEKNPPSYGLTSWEDTPKEEWEFNDFKNEITKHLKDSLAEYCEDHIKHFNAFPVDFVLFEDSTFETKVLFEEYEEILGKDLFDKMALSIYEHYWIDPAFYNNEEHSSDFCEIVEYPIESFETSCYERVFAEDFFEDDNNGLIYGVRYGTYSYESDLYSTDECFWFKTKEEVEKDIIDTSKEGIYIDIENIRTQFSNIQKYPSDAIFKIRTIGGSEAEVTRDELLARHEDCFAVYNGKNLILCPINQEDGLLDLSNLDSYFVKSVDVCENDLQKTIDYVRAYSYMHCDFDFKGDEDYGIEAFYATISGFKLNNDYSIIATLEDSEGNSFDVSWDKIKDSDFITYL